MYEDLISVVIPVYNVKEYLPQCIDSVVGQSYHNLEIILVDDGSTDESGEMCDQYAAGDYRITVIHKSNGGLSDARNAGIEIASGEFIVFIDSDDYVSENYIYDMAMQIAGQTDMVISMMIKFYDEIVFREDKNTPVTFSSEEALADMLYRKNIPIYAWAKLYRRTLFEHIRFPKGQLYEDLAIMHLLMHKAKQIVYVEKYNYFYRQRKGSIIHSSFSHNKMIQIDHCGSLVAFIEEKYPAIAKAAYSKAFIVALNLYQSMPFSKEFNEDRKRALKVVNKYKYIVFKDRNNKRFTRLIALASIPCVSMVHVAGWFYTLLIKKGLLRLKRPI